MFSDDTYGTKQQDGSVSHPFQNVLAWVTIWRDQPCHVLGPPPIPTGSGTASAVVSPSSETGLRCDVMVFIDASNNKYLLATEG